MRRWIAGFVACGLLAACSVDSEDDANPPVVTMGLSSFDACDDVLDHLKSEAHDRVGPWGFGPAPIAVPLSEEAESNASTGDSAGTGGTAHSTTNVQEIGVDEPDVIKTDGRLIVTLAGADLLVIEPNDGSPREVGRLALTVDEGSYIDADLLLSGDHAVVMVHEQSMVAFPNGARTEPDSGTSSDAPIAASRWQPTMSVLLVDLSNPSQPEVESTLQVDGSYVDARMVGDTVRLVVSSAPGLNFERPDGINRRDEDELTAFNRDVIAKSTIEDWLPSYTLSTGADESSGQLVGCEDLSRPDGFAGFSTMSVLTLDPADGLSDGDAVGVLTDGDTVYASTDRLYVATGRWGEPVPMDTPDVPGFAPRPSSGQTTGVHAFDISGDDPARYLASGEVDGRIIGPYAMSEHEDILRIATTERVGPDRDTTESSLVTLEERAGELVQVGEVGGLGRGEDIYAVRYFGSTAYVVTFRRIDPLYVLDLSDPTAPAVSGELKITGYSAYLHHVGDGRLVGVGQEATTEGRTIGAQVSLFDVSDPGSPVKADGHVVPDAWANAEWNPHAFLYWADTESLVVPMQGGDGSGALVLDVGDDSITEEGTITRSDEAPGARYAQVSRSLVIDDELYTLWENGPQVNDLDDLDERAWLDLH